MLIFFLFNQEWLLHTTEVANFLDECQVGDPEVTVGEKSGTATRPAHLLREEGSGRGRAHSSGEAKRDVSDFPAAVHGAKSVDQNVNTNTVPWKKKPRISLFAYPV